MFKLKNHVKFAIASGRIKPGETLPSLREVSSELNVNSNTVAKAYRDLEVRQLVHTRRGVGVIVAERALAISRDSTLTMVKDHLMNAVAECLASGWDKADVERIVSKTLDAKIASRDEINAAVLAHNDN